MSAAVLPLLATPAAGAAAVPPVPSPATVLTVFPWEGSMKDELQGTLCEAPRNCVRVNQFLWDPNGLATIEATIDATPGTKVVFSYSEGARSVTDWLKEHADDPDAPSPDELSFVVIGNPTRAYGGSDSDVLPQTQYQVIDISRQYDFASDFPDNPLNLLTLLNSLAAFTTIHTEYEDVDMYDPANIVWQEGNITYVFVPTENLPLLEPLRRLGLTGLADALNGPLKELVERGYDRSYLPTAAEESARTAALSVPAAADVAAQPVEPKPGPRDAARDGAGVIGTPAASSASDAAGTPDSEAGVRETDGVNNGADQTVPTGGSKKRTKAVVTAEAGTEAASGTSDQATESDDPESDDSTAQSGHRDGDSSSSDDTSGDGDRDG